MLAGYKIDTSLYESRRKVVCRGHRVAGQQVIIKALRGAALTPDSIAMLRHEYRMLSSVQSPYIPKVIDFDYAPGRHVALVMEDIGADSSLEQLASVGLGVSTVLEIGVAAASALDTLHKGGITHYDVKPQNLIRNPHTGRVQLIDLGLAMYLETDAPELTGQEDIAGTLPYLSPEQTGRMNCRVDHRSDLYSLGIVLYELLSGVHPYPASDPLGWVHAHIAARPRPLHERDPAIPKVISDIVAKLLEKDRERRYRSASGLLADLQECTRQWTQLGKIEPFELGREDRSDRFQISERLYGRAQEVKILLGTLDAASTRSRAELVLITGPAGSGKSSLMGELSRPLALRRGLMISGKFDVLQRTTPLTAIVAAFEDAVKQLLSLGEAELSRFRERMTSALGASGRVLTTLVPTLELVIGPQPEVPELGGVERLNRFKLVIERFVGVLAERQQPLVLLLDDLQWMDPASLAVVEHLLGSREIEGLVVVGAYRANEVSETHPLLRAIGEFKKSGVLTHQLGLAPLEVEDVEQLLADSLQSEVAEVRQLAKLACSKTGGNPFFLRQFLYGLHRDGVLAFEHSRGCWTWDVERAATFDTTDDVGDLLLARFELLPKQTRQLLQLAGCIGNRFDLRTLASVSELGFEGAFSALWPALEQRLVLAESHALGRLRTREADDALEADEAGAMLFRFAHDRVQQSAVASVGDAQRRRDIHLCIGRALLEQLGAQEREARVFQIADQLNLGRKAMTESAPRLQLAELDFECGRRAIASAAYSSAASYLTVAAELLDDAQAQHALWFGVHLELGRAFSLSGEYEAAAQEYPVLLSRAESAQERLAVYGLLADHALLTACYADAIAACRSALEILGITWPDDEQALSEMMGQEMTDIETNLRGRDVSSLVDAPALTSPKQLNILEELDRLATLTYLTNSWLLYAWTVLRMTNISLAYGHVSLSGLAYGTFSALLAMQGQHERSQAFGQLALKLSERFNQPKDQGRTWVAYYALAGYYRIPLRQLTAHFHRGHLSCKEGGDLTYASYQLLFEDHMKLASGVPLAELRQDVLERLPFFVQTAPASLALFYGPSVIYPLCSLTGEQTSAFGFEFDSDAFLDMARGIKIAEGWHNGSLLKLDVVRCIAVAPELVARRVASVEDGVRGQFIAQEAYFYGALLLLQTLREEPESEERQRWEALVAQWHQVLQTGAEQCAENFRGMALLVEAELCRGQGQLRPAIAAYEQALQDAEALGALDREALARRLYADFWQSIGALSTAREHANSAMALYREWGADGVVNALSHRYPDVDVQVARHSRLSSSSPSRESTGRQLFESLDLETVTRAARAVSSETSPERLLANLTQIIKENLGATRCVILRGRGTDWEVVAKGDAYGNDDSGVGVPLAIANYVSRTGEYLLLDDPASHARFCGEEYFLLKRPRSVLCAPIRLEERTLAVVYAENELAVGAFTDSHLTLLRTVLAQAAISLDNARLFHELEQEKELWHSLVDNAADLIAIVDRQHRVEFFNRFSEQLALAIETGATIEESFGERYRSQLRAAIDRVFTSGDIQSYDAEIEVGVISRDVSVRLGPIRRGGKLDRVSVIATDVSERRRLADQLRQSQKMEAIGTLAGGVAHDFNNLITVILGTCELGKDMSEDPETVRLLDEIVQAADRAAELTRKLLAFSRKQVLQPKTVVGDELIENLAGLLSRMLGEDVELSVRLAGQHTRICVDPSELEQVILNLAANARDAMPTGGSLLISTRRVLDEGRPYLSIDIQDEGTGMDDATCERIFEPFFTTKPVGKGTGLGLAMVHGIVQQSGGRIQVESKLGEGTRFSILLPEVQGRIGADSVRHVSQAPQGRESVLLVEDDEQLRELVVALLCRLGYSVVAVNDAEAALKLDRQSFDLLFTDVVMPGLSGPALSEVFRQTNPSLKVLFTTGYTDDAVVRHGLLTGTVSLLPKPFTLPALARKIREVLDGKDPSNQ